MKMPPKILCVLFFSVFALAACYQPGGPEPQAPVDAADLVPIPQAVIVEEELIYSPYPRDNGAIPGTLVTGWDCDYIRFTRFRPDTGGAPEPVNAILVLIPGYMGGANSFDYIGRQLVSMAEGGYRGREPRGVGRGPEDELP